MGQSSETEQVAPPRRARATPIYLDRMRMADLEEVAAVEREAYSLPWPSSAYRQELRDNKKAHYIVARSGEPPVLAPDQEPLAAARERRPFPLSLLPPLERPAARPRDPVLGHGGLWRMPDEGHITTIAVRNAYRGHGIGELLLAGLIDLGYRLGTERLTLEVRVSNVVAQNLYTKYGFVRTGVRPRYYSDNNEDAYIMTTGSLATPDFRALLALRHHELAKRLGLTALPDWLAWADGLP